MKAGNKQVRKAYWLAGSIVAGVVLWFGSGSLSTPVATQADQQPAQPSKNAAMAVEVQRINAETVTEEIRLQGHTAPNRQVTLRAQTSGRIEQLLVARGARVTQGQAIARIAMEDRAAQRSKAEALVAQRERDHERTKMLADQGHLAGTRLDEAFALLESARAELASIREDIGKTTVRAPFGGIMNDRSVELGDFVAVRDELFTIVDDQPIVVVASVAQRNKSAITVGNKSSVKLITGESLDGTVRYLSAVADEETRTFAIEIEIPNAGGMLSTGVSAEATVPANATRAHKLSPGWLVRTDNDQFGVYLVDAQGKAQFAPISIVRANTDAVWVTGLPEDAAVVSAGQGFLQEGQPVLIAGNASATTTALAAAPSRPESIH